MTDEKDYDLTEDEKALEAEAQADVEAEPVAEAEAPEQMAKEIEAEREKPEKGFVPLAALDAERHKRKDSEARLAEIEREFQTTRTLLEKLTAAKGGETAPTQPEEMPDPVLAPKEFQAWLSSQMSRGAEPAQQLQAQVRQQQEMHQAVQTLRNYASQHEVQFRSQKPDYDTALDFARLNRAEEYQHVWGMSPDQARQRVMQEEVQVVAQAAQQGLSPAAVIYNYALMRGYTPSQAKSAAEDISRLGAVQKQTASAAPAGGGPRKEGYTMEELANMSESELAKVPDAEIQKAMGG